MSLFMKIKPSIGGDILIDFDENNNKKSQQRLENMQQTTILENVQSSFIVEENEQRPQRVRRIPA